MEGYTIKREHVQRHRGTPKKGRPVGKRGSSWSRDSGAMRAMKNMVLKLVIEREGSGRKVQADISGKGRRRLCRHRDLCSGEGSCSKTWC